MADPPRFTFGLVPPASFLGVEPRLNALLRWLGTHAGVQLVRRHARSYDELVKLLRAGHLDVAWLPPIPFACLEGERIARGLVSAERGGRDQYVAVLIARADSHVHTLDDFHGRRVGWVDPLSATGYVIPRMRLASRLPNALRVFASETFFGSHAAVARALVDGVIDVGATYGGFDDDGTLLRGPFLDIGVQAASLRVVEAFGAIPPDVVAVRTEIADASSEALAEAFVATARDPSMLEHVHVLFGAMGFARKPLVGYDVLWREIENGVDTGIIPAAAAFMTTRPPPGTFG